MAKEKRKEIWMEVHRRMERIRKYLQKEQPEGIMIDDSPMSPYRKMKKEKQNDDPAAACDKREMDRAGGLYHGNGDPRRG